LKTGNKNQNRADASLAATWGFAEAVFFFIVPDVLLSFIALKSLKRALFLSMVASVAAVAGGVLMYIWGSLAFSSAEGFLLFVPLISFDMIRFVEAEMAEHSFLALLLGPLYGTPYKIYATVSGAQSLNLLAFALVSFPARAARFVLVSIATNLIIGRLLAFSSFRKKALLLSALWITFYICYSLLFFV